MRSFQDLLSTPSYTTSPKENFSAKSTFLLILSPFVWFLDLEKFQGDFLDGVNRLFLFLILEKSFIRKNC